MKALITGGAGFIGSSIARRLLERDHEVVVVDNLFAGSADAVPEGASFVDADIRDPAAIRDAFSGVEVVFHQAAMKNVARSVEDPIVTNEVNVGGTLNVLGAATSAGVRRLVYASSSSVYGDTPADVKREDMAPLPMSPYAVSKLAGEQYCTVWSRLGFLSTVSLRYFNVFGPGQRPDSKYAAVFPAFISALAAGQAPEIHSDGEQSRDFTFIDDVVEANLLAAEATSAVDGEVINVAGGSARSINDVLRQVSEAMGTWVDPRFLPMRAGDIRKSLADPEKARLLLGWKPQMEWTEAVARTVAWLGGSTI